MRDDQILLKRIVEYCDAIKDDTERFGNSLDDFIEKT